jgi:fucose permease
MGLGYIAPGDVPVITHTVKQGGIIVRNFNYSLQSIKREDVDVLNKAIYYLGTLVGCLVGGVVGDKYGRTNCILFGACWGMVGAALQCSAQNVAWMCCARVINGVGTGVLNGIVPVRLICVPLAVV